MPRTGILHMISGFIIMAFAAMTGPFLANLITDAFVNNPGELSGWRMTLLQSAHGHLNLFGIIQVLLGCTLLYSKISERMKQIQFLLYICGPVAMGPMMYLRAAQMPSNVMDVNGFVIGGLLSCCLLALGMHIYGLMLKLRT